MSDLKNFLRDVGYFGVGAAAVIVEAGGKAVKALVCKGENVLRENQDTVDEMKEKAREAGKRIKEAVKDLTAKPEPTVEADPEVETSAEECAPVSPDAIYHTDEPAPEEEAPAEAPAMESIEEEPTENAENTING